MTIRLLSVLLGIGCLFAQTSCGIASHQIRRAGNLLKAPVRAITMEENLLEPGATEIDSPLESPVAG